MSSLSLNIEIGSAFAGEEVADKGGTFVSENAGGHSGAGMERRTADNGGVTAFVIGRTIDDA